MQQAIPYFFMRGGSSRGPYFNQADLPQDKEALADILVKIIGSGHPLNIDGIGGGNAVTTKVAILSASDDPWADVDYFFAQVSVEDRLVDFKPTCGNILAGVGPAAIEMGLITPQNDITSIKVRSVNTGAQIVTNLQTPDGTLTYAGNHAIDGVPGTAAPVELHFVGVAGSSTGTFLPTGNLQDEIDGIHVTCMDVAMPMVMARASDFGLTGQESREALDANRSFFAKMEEIRLKAAILMGMGDCSQSVTPKFGLFAAHEESGHIHARYFMPWTAHPTMAVTGSQCMASCALAPGSIAYDLMGQPENGPTTIHLHHPMGVMEVVTDYTIDATSNFTHHSAGLVRTARKLAQGHVFVPDM